MEYEDKKISHPEWDREALKDNPAKVYIDVDAHFTKEGELTPLAITWEDGHRYEVDRVLNVQRCASRKAGGVGIRYTCRICGQTSCLFYEVDRWFVERKTSL